jgi:hypothetical protein
MLQTLVETDTSTLVTRGCVLIVGGATYNYPQKMKTDERITFWYGDGRIAVHNNRCTIPSGVKLVLVVRQFIHTAFVRSLRDQAEISDIPCVETTLGEIKKFFERMCTPVCSATATSPSKKTFSIKLFVMNYYCQDHRVSARREGKRLARIAGRSYEAKDFIHAVKALREECLQETEQPVTQPIEIADWTPNQTSPEPVPQPMVQPVVIRKSAKKKPSRRKVAEHTSVPQVVQKRPDPIRTQRTYGWDMQGYIDICPIPPLPTLLVIAVPRRFTLRSL